MTRATIRMARSEELLSRSPFEPAYIQRKEQFSPKERLCVPKTSGCHQKLSFSVKATSLQKA